MRAWLILTLAVLQIAATAPQPARHRDAESVSLVALIANPAAYDGRAVQVQGNLILEFEGDALYLGKSDANFYNANNAIWVDKPSWVDARAQRALSGRAVFAEGIFSATERGHMGAFAGSLKDIRRLERLPSRGEFGVQLYHSITVPLLIALATSAIIAAVAGWLSLGRKPRSR